MALYHIKVTGKQQDFARLVNGFKIDFGCRGNRKDIGDGYFESVGIADSDTLKQLKRSEFTVLSKTNLSRSIKNLPNKLSKTNRFAKHMLTDAQSSKLKDVRLRGKKYQSLDERINELFNKDFLTIKEGFDEINEACQLIQSRFPKFVEVINLNHLSHEKRTIKALRIGKFDFPSNNPIIQVEIKNKVMFTAGVHPAEWGTVDCLLWFVVDFLRAYEYQEDLTYGNMTFSYSELDEILENIEILMIPCVNPDGLKYDQNNPPDPKKPGCPEDGRDILGTRKNRHKVVETNDPRTIGVDLNRNLDFVFKFKKILGLDNNSGNSTIHCHSRFQGPEANSEKETKNVIDLLDSGNVRMYMDIHSSPTGAGPFLAYPWGIAPNQSTDRAKSFGNPAFDGKRISSDYAEYMPEQDEINFKDISEKVVDSMKNVRGIAFRNLQNYPAFGILTGVNDDYAYSRQFDWSEEEEKLIIDENKKTLGFTLEMDSSSSLTTRTPDHKDFWEGTMLDNIAGLVEFCKQGAKVFPKTTYFTTNPNFGVEAEKVIGGVFSGGGGFVVVNGKPRPVEPRPMLTELVAKLLENKKDLSVLNKLKIELDAISQHKTY
ncbi:MAG: hypothetical protein IT219_10775 [Bacteroidales bacterium]|nr:hypothetical protein [Bacteroidales bacterium]